MSHDDDVYPASDDDVRDLTVALTAARPTPTPGFRGALGRRLASADRGYGHRPPRLRETAAVLIGVGVLLLAVGLMVGIGLS